jgi:hypothetical protein
VTPPPSAPDPVPLRDLISRNLRRLREGTAVGHEDLARAAHRYGLGWTASWLASAERGAKAITAEQLVALPVVLSDALGFRVGLADLLFGDEPVLLAKEATGARDAVSPTYLREVLTAPAVRRAFTAPGTPFATAVSDGDAMFRAAEKMREIARAGLGDVDIRALARAEAGAGEAEDKLARRLAVPPIVVIAAAASLWGRALSEERAARLAVDPEAPHTKPGTVTRQLSAEVTARIMEAESESSDPLPDGPAPSS